jgi:molybdate transport system substrate-binding protein
MIRRALLLTLLAGLLAGCFGFTGDPTVPPGTQPSAAATRSPTPTPTATPGPVDLTVFAAASLKGVLDQVKPAYEAAHPGVTLTISTDSSAALRTKIEQGAPADVFLSADTDNVAALVTDGLAADNDVAYFAGNSLTIVVPAGNPAHVTSEFDLARAGLRIIAAGDEVPISKYAKRLVDAIAGQDGAPQGYAAAYAANVVSKEDNVKAVVAKIELGEGDAAIVYETDARASGRVVTVPTPSAPEVWAIYAGVVLTASPSVAAGQAFLEWLRGREAGRFLVDAGFFIPPA